MFLASYDCEIFIFILFFFSSLFYFFVIHPNVKKSPF